MKKITILFFTVLSIVPAVGNIRADVTLTIDPDTLCSGSTDNSITLHIANPSDSVDAVRLTILFDTDCFVKAKVSRTRLSDAFIYFKYIRIEDGIQISMANTRNLVLPWTGPLAEINVDVRSECSAGEYIWDLARVTVSDPHAQGIPVTELDGIITVSECTMCSLSVSATDFDFGDVCLGCRGSRDFVVTNVGLSPGFLIITHEGCAETSPVRFSLDIGSSQKVKVHCKPQEPGRCDGRITIAGCGDIEIPVTCNGVYKDTVVLSIPNGVVFHTCDNGLITLDLENDIAIAGLQTDVFFDTTCFKVTRVRKTERSSYLDIFAYSDIEGGIRIAITGLGHQIDPGSGPVAEILFCTHHVFEGNFVWNITHTIAADPLGTEIFTIETDGTITITGGQNGDINMDGNVNALDVVLVTRIILGQFQDLTLREREAADCNDDGEIDITDVIGIVNIVLELGTCPP